MVKELIVRHEGDVVVVSVVSGLEMEGMAVYMQTTISSAHDYPETQWHLIRL